jgi:6-phosphogluconate dehydrogenase
MFAEISNFTQSKEEDISQAWGRYYALERRCPAHGLKNNELLDIFYNGLTKESRSYLDSVAGNIFRHTTVEEAKELLNTIHQNYNDWHIELVD